MIFALLLWLVSALTAATLAAQRCNHLQLGLLFIVLAALPPVALACRTQKRKPQKNRIESSESM